MEQHYKVIDAGDLSYSGPREKFEQTLNEMYRNGYRLVSLVNSNSDDGSTDRHIAIVERQN